MCVFQSFAGGVKRTLALFTTTLPDSFSVTTNTIVLFFSRHMLVTNVWPGNTGLANRTRTDRKRETSLFAQCFNTARVANPKVQRPCKMGSCTNGVSVPRTDKHPPPQQLAYRKSIHRRHVRINMQRIVIARQTIQLSLVLARHALVHDIWRAFRSLDRLGITLSNILEEIRCDWENNKHMRAVELTWNPLAPTRNAPEMIRTY